MLTSDQMLKVIESMNKYGNQLFELAMQVENGTEKPDPLTIGRRVLELLGFSVEIAGFGYDSAEVTVMKDGETVFHQFYGR